MGGMERSAGGEEEEALEDLRGLEGDRRGSGRCNSGAESNGTERCRRMKQQKRKRQKQQQQQQ